MLEPLAFSVCPWDQKLIQGSIFFRWREVWFRNQRFSIRTRTLDRTHTLDHIRRLGKGLAQESLAARQPTTDYNRLRTIAIRRSIGNILRGNIDARNIRARSRQPIRYRDTP
jgi:hypothetical protein